MKSDKQIGKVIGLIAVLLLLALATHAETRGGTPIERAAGAAATALVLCCEADQLSGEQRQRALIRGLELAREAAAADPADAQAHFAVFCNLGKQVQSRALPNLEVIGRLRRELDTTLALAPGDADALAAKGAMLLALPWFLGGDVHQGERLLRTALIKDPTNGAARKYLAEALRARGADTEAEVLEASVAPGAVCSHARTP